MATKKFLFLNSSEGFPEEQAATDDLSVGKVTASGVGGVGFDAGSQLITNVATPVSGTDAANKTYVDNVLNGLDWKASVRAISTTNIVLSGAQTIDGVSCIATDRVLVAGQTLGQNNGIYVVAAGAWARSTDADTSAEVTTGMACFVEEGTTYGDTAWVLTTNNPITLGSTVLAFTQFSGGASITAGAGLLLTGLVMDVELDTAAAAQTAGSGGGSSGLEFDTSGAGGKLRSAVNATGGLQRTASGLGVLLNGTTLQSGASGVSVKGVGALFEIATVATSANVTAANLGTLTAGTSSNASALHYHQDEYQIFTSSGSITKGDGVYFSGNDVVSTGQSAGTLAQAHIIGVADQTVTTGQPVRVKTFGTVTGVLSGATFGDNYYLGSAGTPVVYGSLAAAARVIRLGMAKNATDLEVRLGDFSKKTV